MIAELEKAREQILKIISQGCSHEYREGQEDNYVDQDNIQQLLQQTDFSWWKLAQFLRNRRPVNIYTQDQLASNKIQIQHWDEAEKYITARRSQSEHQALEYSSYGVDPEKWKDFRNEILDEEQLKTSIIRVVGY